MENKSYEFIEIPIEIKVLTGLSIRNERETFEVGGLDNPVIKILVNKKRVPIIPGSSLKGKIRCELERKYGIDNQQIKDLFGHENSRSRVIFSDLLPTEETIKKWEEFERKEMSYDFGTEIKVENIIDRSSGKARDLRKMERVLVGSVFRGTITYIVENQNNVKKDMELLKEGLKMVAQTYLGGCGSRGYGRVEIRIPSQVDGREVKVPKELENVCFKPEFLEDLDKKL